MEEEKEIKNKNEEFLNKEDDSFDFDFIPEDGEGNEESMSIKNKKLREELKKCSFEKNDYLTGWQRAKADYVNLKKEADDNLRKGIELGKTAILEDILPALDSFDMAMSNKDVWEKVDEKWRIGIEYIKTQIVSTLESNGIKSFGEKNEVFDPNLHESIETVESENKEDTGKIAVVIQKGYSIKEKIIRPARVKVWG